MKDKPDFYEKAKIGAKFFKFSIKMLSEEGRKREKVEARAIISDYLVQNHKVSRGKIAIMFNRNTSCISKACKMARELPDYCYKFRDKKERFWRYMMVIDSGGAISEYTIETGGKSHLPGGKITYIKVNNGAYSHQ